MNEKQPKYSVGTTFKLRGKQSYVCTVVDVWVTRNLAGEITLLRYVAEHEFAGQTVIDRDVCETTISMGLQAQEVTK